MKAARHNRTVPVQEKEKEDTEMQNQKIICADAATENCPCLLAETGDCLICSRLQGKNECGCDWAGVCVYNEFIQNNRKRALTRAEKSFIISDMKATSDGGFVIMDIDCGRGFTLGCMSPGIHLFIRPDGRERYYDTPLSVLKADHTAGIVTVCFRTLSAKTKALAECRAGGAVIVRGPYRNGIKGLPRGLSGRKVLIAAAGAGVIPAVAAGGLLAAHNDIEIAVLDAGAAEREIVDGYLDDGIAISGMKAGNNGTAVDGAVEDAAGATDGRSEEFYRKLQSDNFDAYIILGSTGFVNDAADVVKKSRNKNKNKNKNINVMIAVSNNSVMSCGEGVCGACACFGDDGRRIAGCKCTEALL